MQEVTMLERLSLDDDSHSFQASWRLVSLLLEFLGSLYHHTVTREYLRFSGSTVSADFRKVVASALTLSLGQKCDEWHNFKVSRRLNAERWRS